MPDLQYISKNYNEKRRLSNESLFHTASGKLGIRGNFEEGVPEGMPSIRGAYLNGFCESEPIRYNEKLYGFPEEKQQIVNLPDMQTIHITAGDEPVVCWKGDELVQTLDMKNGVYERSFRYNAANGRLTVTFTRLVSFIYPEVYAVECRIKSESYTGTIRVSSSLNANVTNFTDKSDPRVASGNGRLLKINSCNIIDDALFCEVQTNNSARRVSCAALHDFNIISSLVEEGTLSVDADYNLKCGDEFVFHKYCVYSEIAENVSSFESISLAKKVLDLGFAELKSQQRLYLDSFWKCSRVYLEGNEELQSQVDFCLYSLLSSAGKDGFSNVPAKGLSGEGYEGHYFWDSEIYVFPFFLMTQPETAKALLKYRYNHLPQAKKHAMLLGHSSGALYPWRTIAGSECSSHYPTGSAQYHINGDIAKAFSSYWDATSDISFLPEICEVLVETARLWIDVGHWTDFGFCIDCVTGPDEYTCMVNNNYYTNSCAACNMLDAARICRELEKYGGLNALKDKIGLSDDELAEFQKTGEGIYYPFDEKLGIIKQDDSFLNKKRWEICDIPKENFPLLIHYHPLYINRCQILKQADSVLANHLYHEETPLIMRRSYDYYEQITTHDSSLSNCIYSVMAARLGDIKKASEYFYKCVGTDTSDNNGNTRDGLHIANIAGVYKALTAGFGGYKVDKNGLSLFPLLPEGIASMRFSFFYKGSLIGIYIVKDACTLHLESGKPVELQIYGKMVKVDSDITVFRKMNAVIFDLDGVITDTAKFHYQAWKKIADELGIDFDEKKNEQFKGVSRAECLKLLLFWGGICMDEKDFQATLVKKNNYYREMLSSLTTEDILPGISNCIDELKADNIPVALFSVSKNTPLILEKIGLSGCFDAVVCGDDIQNSKPHYEGYLLAAERLSTDPRLCVMVEDSSAGITGAKSLSLGTLAIMNENTENADICIPSTEVIEDAIFGMLK